MNHEADIAIIGGGLTGACLANLLLQQTKLTPERVLLIEPRLEESLNPSASKRGSEDIDLRVSAISRSTERILAAGGVWERLRAGRISPYERMWVWDEAGKPQGSGAAGAIHFDCADLRQPNLGYIIENRLMQAALLDRARETGVRLMAAEVTQLQARDGSMSISLRDGGAVSAGLVVGADGADSPARRMMKIAVRGASYEQRAIVTHVRTSDSHQRTAWQRFLSTGPIALLPLQDGLDNRRSSIVWSTTETVAHELMAHSEEEFCRAVERATDGVLGRVESCARRVDFPLRRARAERYVLSQFALVGDAAHAVHPLAGQGVNLCFLDCAALAEVIGEALTRGEAPGELRVLRRYERWRKGENLLMLAALDGLNRLFSNDDPTLGVLRRMGLRLIDRVGPIKTLFMRRALGLEGDLPRLATVDLS
jgi:2-octaprenylphenol hydroxylase